MISLSLPFFLSLSLSLSFFCFCFGMMGCSVFPVASACKQGRPKKVFVSSQLGLLSFSLFMNQKQRKGKKNKKKNMELQKRWLK
jgi:hypothetical protein